MKPLFLALFLTTCSPANAGYADTPIEYCIRPEGSQSLVCVKLDGHDIQRVKACGFIQHSNARTNCARDELKHHSPLRSVDFI